MKIKSKLILPILTLAATFALGIGTTYALFTNDAKTDISVQAGKVKYSMLVNELELYSPTEIDTSGVITDDTNAASGTTFFNGGTATLDGSSLSLSYVTPGDKATFKIKTTNSSTVLSKYRITFSDETVYTGAAGEYKLIDYLNIKVNGHDILTSTIVKWTAVNPGSSISDITVSIELDTLAPNEVIALSSKIKFSLDAVQGNALTEDPTTVACRHESCGSGQFGVIWVNDVDKMHSDYAWTLIEAEDDDTVKCEIRKDDMSRRLQVYTYLNDIDTPEQYLFDGFASEDYTFTAEAGTNYAIVFGPFMS